MTGVSGSTVAKMKLFKSTYFGQSCSFSSLLSSPSFTELNPQLVQAFGPRTQYLIWHISTELRNVTDGRASQRINLVTLVSYLRDPASSRQPLLASACLSPTIARHALQYHITRDLVLYCGV